uniref:Orange domain-containing protein n=2 Tax=Oncorhynchus tshawytscha TaxID=74940 RepID=A0AAZ3PLN6_ONCTS
MTVCFLKRQQQYQPVSSSSCSAPVNQGYSRCVQEIVHFLSKDEVKTQSQRRLLSHFQSLQPSSDKNRMESDLPQLSSPTQHSMSKVQSTAPSGGPGRVLQNGVQLADNHNGPCWSKMYVMDSSENGKIYSSYSVYA